jgi:FtsH-binding integral membrane protein
MLDLISGIFGLINAISVWRLMLCSLVGGSIAIWILSAVQNRWMSLSGAGIVALLALVLGCVWESSASRLRKIQKQ